MYRGSGLDASSSLSVYLLKHLSLSTVYETLQPMIKLMLLLRRATVGYHPAEHGAVCLIGIEIAQHHRAL